MPAVISLGNFDGLHLGHQAILSEMLAKARELKIAAVVILFEPQANEYFALHKNPEAIPARLTRWREKISILSALGIDAVLCLRFDANLAALSAHDFLEQMIFPYFAVKHWVIGDDFHFGADRKGNRDFLIEQAKLKGFTLSAVPSVQIEGVRVSSTAVRKALAEADLVLVKQYLGRGYSLEGRVAYGAQRGRLLGFPTANIHLQRKVTAIQGVFAVKVKGLGPEVLKGVANLGLRPTVKGSRVLLEVHVFDFNETIYGRHLEIELIYKLRDEKRFDDLQALQAQILEDAKQARDFFAMEKDK